MMNKGIFFLIVLACWLPVQLFAQNIRLSGIVYDKATAQPLIGAAVKIKETGIGVVTDSSGHFIIPNAGSRAQTIIISSVAYNTRSFLIKETGTNDIKLPMSNASNELSEVVVATGYTQQSKNKTVGSVTTLKGSEVANVPVASFDVMLQGRIPGLYVGTPTGQPGEAGRVTLRGMGSISGDVQPLYIVDGMQVSNTSFSGLNPDDFETITVLKDAASTAQYGSRAANGIIVIQTKNGKRTDNGKLNIDFKSYLGISTVNSSKWDQMNTGQRLQFEEILQDPSLPGWAYSAKNPFKLQNGALVPKTQADYDYGKMYLDSLSKINTDWRKILLRTGKTQSYNLNVSGGTENTGIYLSFGYLDQQGIALNSGIKRYSLRSNITNTSGRLKSSLNIGFVHSDISYIQNEGTAPGGGAAAGGGGMAANNPIAALFFALPYERPDASNTGPGNYGSDALNEYQGSSLKNSQNKAVLSLNESFSITNELQLNATAGLEYQQDKVISYLSPTSYFGQMVSNGNAGMYQDSLTTRFRYLLNAGARYLKRWNGDNELEANVLFEANRARGNYSGFTGYGLAQVLGNTGAAITPGTSSNNFIPNVAAYSIANNLLLSQIALLRYSWAGRYTLTASARIDGTSQTPAANRNILLYALGGKWNLMKEDFMQHQNIFSMLQLRGSYGLTANAGGFAGDFTYRNLYGITNYNGNMALYPQTPGNPSYRWETNKIADVGLEFGILHNRIVGEIDVYNRITDHLFINQNLSLTSGWPSIASNSGKVRNQGIELALSGDIIRTKDTKLTLGLNFAYNKNKVLSLGTDNMQFIDNVSINKVGMPLGTFYAVRWKGVDPQTGTPIYLDKNGKETNTYNTADAVPLKAVWDPPYKGGVNVGFSYKNFSSSIVISFIHGMSRLNYPYLYSHSGDPNYRRLNQSADMLHIWQKPGDITSFQGADYTSQVTSRDIQSSDYIKLRNVSLNYMVPLSEHTRKYIRKLSVFVQGQNLFSIMKWKGFDPEDANDIAQYEYPMPITVTTGVNISF